jgi:DNA-binding transcriptional ArsR family regulator
MEDGRIGHAELRCDDGAVMLASPFEGFGRSPLDLPDVHGQIYCTVEDVNAHFARAPARTVQRWPRNRTTRMARACTARSILKVIGESSRSPESRPDAVLCEAARPRSTGRLPLADPARRRVVELLRREPKRAGDIAAGLGMSAPATSRLGRLLHRTGLVEAMSVGDDARLRIFRLRPEPFVELHDWLAQVERFWAGQLEAFRAHTARTRGPRRRAGTRGRRE